ncbi:MaoC/PaaZ C-terminal domain-containing protein [Pseudonocardia sp.]|uniref:MaoC/PaaZ C-terminal domain-containing protein n=1 Tax=Pseudonocardia sp. TaxID=60912 RepID=UPI0032C23727
MRMSSFCPHGEPDLVLTVPTRQDQALLYRLCGDDNPLHLDPEAAARVGFDRPILHGLCAYGIVGRVLLAAYAASVPARFHSLAARFQAGVSRRHLGGRGMAKRRLVKTQHGETVLTNGTFLLRE